MSESKHVVTLWRPVGPKELELIEASGMQAFPPRLPDQPIFYPVTTEAYATQIARDWNVPASGSGFVTRFDVLKGFLDRYRVEHAGSKARSGILDSGRRSARLQQGDCRQDRSDSRFWQGL